MRCCGSRLSWKTCTDYKYEIRGQLARSCCCTQILVTRYTNNKPFVDTNTFIRTHNTHRIYLPKETTRKHLRASASPLLSIPRKPPCNTGVFHGSASYHIWHPRWGKRWYMALIYVHYVYLNLQYVRIYVTRCDSASAAARTNVIFILFYIEIVIGVLLILHLYPFAIKLYRRLVVTWITTRRLMTNYRVIKAAKKIPKDRPSRDVGGNLSRKLGP